MATELTIDNLGQDYSASPEEIGELFKDLKDDPPEPKERKEGAPAPTRENADEDDHDDTDDDDDERRGGRTQEELDATTVEGGKDVRERKRQDRLNQRQRQRARIDTLERELAQEKLAKNELHQRLSSLENVNVGSQYAYLQQAEQKAVETVNGLKDIIAEATAKGDGVRVAEATHALAQVLREQEIIVGNRQRFEQEARQPQRRQQTTPQLDPETMSNATAFLKKHSWYKGPKSNDRDSRILAMLDNEMTNEGWNPRSDTYWSELETRAKQYLGHRFTEGQAQEHNGQRRQNRQPVAGGGSSNNGGGGQSSESYRLSSERVRAMKEAGIWDDPKRRANMIKRYQDADRAAANNT